MKKDIRRICSFFSLFQSLWIPYIIATLIVAGRNFIIVFLNALISSKITETVLNRTALLDSLIQICIWIVAFSIFDSIGVYSQTTIIHRISIKLRGKMFKHAIDSSLQSLDTFGNREELLSRMNYDVENATGLLSYGFLSPIMCCISGIGATCIILAIDWRVCLFVYVLGILILGVQLALSSIMRKNSSDLQQVKSDVLSISMQTFQDSINIKMSSMTQYVFKLFSEKISGYYGVLHKKGIIDGIYGVVQGIMHLAAFFCVFCYCYWGGMSLERIVLVVQVSPLVATMILSITDMVSSVQRSMAGIDRIIEIFEMPLEDKSGKNFVFDMKNKGIKTEGLKCKYDSKVVDINDFTVCADDGNIIALKGASGCGKTTLLRLLLKLYPYSDGNLGLLA